MLELGVKLVIRKIYILLFMTVKYLTLSKLLHKYNKHFLSFYHLSSLWLCLCLNLALFSFHFVRLYKGCCCLFKLEVRQSIVRSCLYNFICPQSLGSRAETSKLIASEKIKLFQRQIVESMHFSQPDTPSHFGVVMTFYQVLWCSIRKCQFHVCWVHSSGHSQCEVLSHCLALNCFYILYEIS
jgi:hypothetical protein